MQMLGLAVNASTTYMSQCIKAPVLTVPRCAVQDHIHAVVSDAVNASVENFVSPFLEHAAEAMESASDVMERLPSAFLDKAFSKSLDVVTPFERMAR